MRLGVGLGLGLGLGVGLGRVRVTARSCSLTVGEMPLCSTSSARSALLLRRPAASALPPASLIGQG